MYIYTIWLERMTYMSSFRESMMVAFAFVGVVVGAGFATGQEIFNSLRFMGWQYSWSDYYRSNDYCWWYLRS